MAPSLLVVGAVLALLAVASALLSVRALHRHHWLRGAGGILVGAGFAAGTGLAALLSFGTAGYRNLTHEALAATVAFERLEPQRYRATFTFPDGGVQRTELRGDAFVVEAKILKWHPAAAALGLRTGYTLERATGRYEEIGAERSAPRSAVRLGEARPVDVFGAVRRWPRLAPWVDATYGSAAFAPMEHGARYEVRVTTSGLLVRPLPRSAPGLPGAERRSTPRSGTIHPSTIPSPIPSATPSERSRVFAEPHATTISADLHTRSPEAA